MAEFDSKVVKATQAALPPPTDPLGAVGQVARQIVINQSAVKKLESAEGTALNTQAVTSAEELIKKVKGDPDAKFQPNTAERDKIKTDFKKLEEFMPQVFKEQTSTGKNFVIARKVFDQYSVSVENLNKMHVPTAAERAADPNSAKAYDEAKHKTDINYQRFEILWRKYYTPANLPPP